MRVHLVALLLVILAAGASAQAVPGRSGQPGLLPPSQPGGPTLSPGAAVASITVSPDSATVDAGVCRQFTAEARGPGGGVENVGPFTFTLSNPTASLVARAAYQHPATPFRQRAPGTEILTASEVIIGAACWVANHGPEPGTTDFPNPTKALAEVGEGKNPFAIVAMEWKVGQGVKFYAFGRDGRLVTAAALDSEGPKFVPNACLACHGGLFDPQAGEVQGAAFLPFDVSTFRLRSDLPYDFAKLNALVANTREGRDAITEFVDGLNREGDHYVPVSWAGKEDVYRQVIKPYCRTCHLAVRPDVIASAQQFQGQSTRLQAVLCNIGSMPHAEVPFKRLWSSPDPYAPGLLKAALGISCGS